MIDRRELEREIIVAMNAAVVRQMTWGKDDCALWVADILRKTQGFDPAADFRGHYRSKNGAHRLLGKGGLLRALRRISRRHHWVKINPAWAKTGDVGICISADGTPSTLICRKKGWFVGRSEAGFCAISADKVRWAWSIDRDFRIEPGARISIARPLQLTGIQLPGPVHEPVSTFIGLTAIIESLGASAAVAGAIGGVIVGTAISAGLSFLSQLLIPKPDGSGALGTSSQSNDVQFTETQSIPSKRVILGSAYVGGPIFFEKVVPPYLYVGVLINHGEISGVDTIWIGTNELTFNNIAYNAILTPLPIAGQPDYASNLKVSIRTGGAAQAADPLLVADFADLDPNFRQQGIATIVLRYKHPGDYTSFTGLWGNVQRPSTYTLIRGVAVYDPRDATQDVNDETTWKWSDNASLIQAYYLTRDWGGRIAKAKIRWDKVATAADYDDEIIGCEDGTFIKRHTINGVVTLDQKPSEVMNALLSANRGYVVQSGGMYWVTSSKPRTPVCSIYDAILSGSIQVQGAKPKANLINKLQTRFVAQEQNYQTVDLPILERADYEAEDEETLTGTLNLPFTLDYRRAERLQSQFLDTARLGKTVTVTVDISLLADLDDDVICNEVTVASDLFPVANGSYLCTAMAFADNCTTLALTLSEYDSSIETVWKPTDEVPFTLASPFTL